MKRALILIVLLSLLLLSLGLFSDLTQRRVAEEYLLETAQMRRQLHYGGTPVLREMLSQLNARWERDSRWLNCLIDHHHTRAVSTALRQLGSALEMGLETETIKALDLLQDAFGDIHQSDFPSLENVL